MLRVAGIVRESIVDGDGIRYVLFLQGCKHGCKGCHNPETWNFDGGNEREQSDILEEILENPLIDGVTFSGGDPLFQASELINIVKELHDKDINMWLYTGFVFEDFILFKNNCCKNELVTRDMIELLQYIDVVVDGPFEIDNKSFDCKFRGSKNQRLINCKESLRQNEVILIE